ncbi:trihelix transcription factor ENAP1-like [Rutidosis leptorrhynchoides]|uniref:trihelix transcription factor ENAP1-like n=1 Tax=Rutidosis leptorrhynchoides TaxID=125765 RepID=UPI003A996AD5
MADDLALTNYQSPATVAGATQPPSSRPIPFREDCWTEDATSTLVDAWGRRYLELNRGNLRQKDWQDVADAVNARHGHTKKTRRTDVQCKNRIDTLKKKYKVEKARVSESNGQITSTWPFYSRLDPLIGSAAMAKKSSATMTPSPSPPTGVPLPYRKPPTMLSSPQFSTPLAILPQKRPAPVAPAVDESYFRRNYSAVAAAAAAAEEEGSEDDVSLESSEDEGAAGGGEGGRKESGGETDSMKRLASAIERFGKIYERVEGEKQKQMIELEKQRMQFTKDLEVQRMQLFMDTQVQLEKIKQVKRNVSDDDVYS